MPGCCSTSGLFWALEKAELREPLLILSRCCAPPGDPNLRSGCAFFWALGKANMRWPPLILFFFRRCTGDWTSGILALFFPSEKAGVR